MTMISVIIPAYNAEKTVLETIASVQKQSFSDFELVVIDDGSNDQTLKLLNSVKDPRIKIFPYPNGGVSIARNRGISQAKGEFIAILDADDLWTPDKLELQLAALQQNHEAGVAYSWAYYMDEEGQSIKPSEPIYYEGNVYAKLLVNDFIVSCSNCLIRREAVESVGGFDPAVPGAADWDYWLRLAANWLFVVVPKHQVFYRFSAGSMSSNVEFMERCNLQVIEKGFATAPLEMQSLKNHSIANSYRYSANLYLLQDKNVDAAKQAIQKLGQAIRLYPPILKDSWTRNLLIKALMLQLLPTGISRSSINLMSKLRLHFKKVEGIL